MFVVELEADLEFIEVGSDLLVIDFADVEVDTVEVDIVVAVSETQLVLVSVCLLVGEDVVCDKTDTVVDDEETVGLELLLLFLVDIGAFTEGPETLLDVTELPFDWFGVACADIVIEVAVDAVTVVTELDTFS